MKKVAVITDATSAGFFFPAWHRYYGGQFGAKSLHVVTYEGMKPLFAGFELGNLWEINTTYDDTLRAGVISDLVGVLLRSHDVVLRCDVDEFLVPDPVHAPDLWTFVERNELPYVTANGIDIVEVAEEAPLDKSRVLPDGQRRFGMHAAALSKTALTTIPMRWAEGFHGATVPPVFAGLYNLHMKFADIKSRIAWHDWMVAGIQPGTNAHQYFAVGDAHLSEVHHFLASRPRRGDETEAAFAARFLASVRLNERNGIYQGEFIRQDFLVRLDRLLPGAARNALCLYESASLSAPPEGYGLVRQLEAPREQAFNPPALVCDLSGRGLAFTPPGMVHIHGSDLVRRENVLLFGPNHLVSPEGYWFREAQGENGGTMPPMQGSGAVEMIDEPVFLATPLEPACWGRWIVTVLPKIAQYRAYGEGRKFLCHVEHEWQRAFLRLFGVPEVAVLPHHPGRTYMCQDVMTVEYSNVNISISAWERANAFEIVALHRAPGRYPRKIFVPRPADAKANPRDNAMRNEAELTARLEERGFVAVVPEEHPLEVRIAMFAAAEEIVCLGGAGLYNVVFCAPGTGVVTVESTDTHVGLHANLLATLGLRYGVIFGGEEQAGHGAWTLELGRALPEMDAFFAGDQALGGGG